MARALYLGFKVAIAMASRKSFCCAFPWQVENEVDQLVLLLRKPADG